MHFSISIVFPSSGYGRLYVPEFAPIKPEIASAANLNPEPIYRSAQQPSFALYLLPEEPAVTPLELPVTFENMITLLGYDLLTCEDDQSLSLVTHWQVEKNLPWDLTIFVHVIAQDGSIVTQHDGLDAEPTKLHAGDSFIQYHELPGTDIKFESQNLLQIGLYRHYEGSRILHDGDPPDRYILIDDIKLCQPE